jgi:hypothetical protein
MLVVVMLSELFCIYFSFGIDFGLCSACLCLF